jgi:hypothetical protein
VAVSQIRRSAGRIHGLQLALFDGLLFPLLTLGAVIAMSGVALAKMLADFYAIPSVIGHAQIPLVTRMANWLSLNKEVAVFVGVLAALVVNVLIVRVVMRAVRRGVATAPPESSATGNEIKVASIAIILALIATALGALAAIRNAGAWPAMTLSLLFAGMSILMALPVRRLGVGKCALIIAALGMVIWPLIAFGVRQTRTAAGVNASGIERVEVTEDRAVVRQRHFDGEGMIVTFGLAPNRWTPSGVYLEAMFDVTLEPRWFGGGANSVIRTRRGIHWGYRLDGPPGPMLGKVVFHPGTPTPETDGSYVIGEFRPDNAEPLPIAVRLENDKQVNSFPVGEHVSRNHLSIIATYDQSATTLHYVLFHEGDILTTSSGTTSYAWQNPATNIWVDEGAVKLKNGRSFGYRRDALYPNELHINGTAYDLRKGHVIVLRDDGVAEQFRLFPLVATARDPEAMSRLIHFEEAGSGSTNLITRSFPLRHRLASEMADDLRQILLNKPGQKAKPSADNQEILVTAPPEVLARAQTFITVNDWPDPIIRGPDFQYPNDTVTRAARSYFDACAIDDSGEVFAKLLSPGVLAKLKGDTKGKEFQNYQMGGVPDPDWEKSLRSDWPGKKAIIERLVREWNRYPLNRLSEDPGINLGFGIKCFCSGSFEGAPKPFYQIIIEPDRTKPSDSNASSYLFSSLPPWWNGEATKPDDSEPPHAAAAPGEPTAAALALSYKQFDQTPHSGWRVLAQDGELFREAAALIEAYLARVKLDPSEQINLHFHAAQCLAFAGDTKSVLDALGHLKQARHATEPPDAPLCWNEYVNATEAFLRGDLDALKAARELIAIGPKLNGIAANLDVVDRLIARFGQPYREAYSAEPENQPRPSAKPLSEQTVHERRNGDPLFKLYTVVFKVTADRTGKVQTFTLSRIIDPLSPEAKLPEIQLPQAYLDVAWSKSEAALQKPPRRGSLESISCFRFTPEQPAIVITDLNLPLGQQP